MCGTNATTYLQAVIGFFLLARLGAESGASADAVAFAFSVGVLFWTQVFVTLFSSLSSVLAVRRETPQPTVCLFVAPPSAASLAWVAMARAAAAAAASAATTTATAAAAAAAERPTRRRLAIAGPRAAPAAAWLCVRSVRSRAVPLWAMRTHNGWEGSGVRPAGREGVCTRQWAASRYRSGSGDGGGSGRSLRPRHPVDRAT